MDRPDFALGAGLLALHWLARGYGYEITGADVWAAYSSTMEAAERIGKTPEIREHISKMVASAGDGGHFVARILGRQVGLPS